MNTSRETTKKPWFGSSEFLSDNDIYSKNNKKGLKSLICKFKIIFIVE